MTFDLSRQVAHTNYLHEPHMAEVELRGLQDASAFASVAAAMARLEAERLEDQARRAEARYAEAAIMKSQDAMKHVRTARECKA